MNITTKVPTAQQYIDLRVDTGMGPKSIDKADIALKNSLHVVTIWDNDILVGFGRIVGDGAISYVVSDIMVASTHQRLGIGKMIMSEIDKYFEEYTDKDAYIILLANQPANKLYEQYKFEDSLPKSLGMKRNQLK